MSVVMEAAIAANVILDLIEAFKKQGITVSVADLEDAIAKREEQRKKLNEELGIG